MSLQYRYNIRMSTGVYWFRKNVTCISNPVSFISLTFRSRRRRCSTKKGVLKIFSKFKGKHLCQSLFFNTVAGLRPVTLLKKRVWHIYFPVNFEKFWRTPFWQNTSGRLLLELIQYVARFNSWMRIFEIKFWIKCKFERQLLKFKTSFQQKYSRKNIVIFHLFVIIDCCIASLLRIIANINDNTSCENSYRFHHRCLTGSHSFHSLSPLFFVF